MVNKRLFFHLKQSIIFSWLLSYIMILIIPLSFSGIIHYIATNTVENEINASRMAMLKQVQLSIDNLLNDTQRLSLDIAFNPRVEVMIHASGEDGTSDSHYNAVQFFKEFQRFNLTNGYMENFYIYFKNSDYVISPSGSGESELMYQILGYNRKLPYARWIESLSDKYGGNQLYLDPDTYNKQEVNNIAYFQSIPINGVEEVQGTIVILLNTRWLHEMLQNISGMGQSDIYIVDKDNNILTAVTGHKMPNTINYDRMTQDSGIFHEKIEDEHVSVSYITSGSSALKYVSVTPNSVFFKQSTNLKRLMYISIILSLLFGGIIAALLTKRNYNPVKEIVKALFPDRDRMRKDDSQNEYSIILQAVRNTLDEKDKLNKKFRLQYNALRSNFIVKLMKGYAGERVPIPDILDSLDMYFKSDCFAVILIYHDDISTLVHGSNKGNPVEDITMNRFIIANVFEELACKCHQGFVVEIDGMQACLVNFSPDFGSDGKEDMTSIVREACSFLDQHFRIQITTALSNVHETYHGIPKAYEEAYDAMEYKLVMGKEPLTLYDKVTTHGQQYFYPLETEQKLINSIKIGSYENIEGIINEVFVCNYSQGELSVQMAKCLMFELIGTVIKTISDMNMVYGNIFSDQNQAIERLLECKNTGDMKKVISDILKDVSGTIRNIKNGITHKLSDEVMEFIENNYSDVNLCVASIAEHFDLTPTYISKLFREQSGEGLLDYINKVRLDKAKALIKPGKLGIAETAVRVGYSNSNVFIRTFKKYEGITPGQYKDTQ